MALPGISQNFTCWLQAFLGPSDYSHQTVTQYQNASQETAVIADSVTIGLAANVALQAATLATLFPEATTPVFLIVEDITSSAQSFNVATQNSATGNVLVQAGGFAAWKLSGTLPTALYLSNPNATAGIVKISVVSQ